MGEHGFIGLALFLLLLWLAFRNGTWIKKNAASREDLRWAADLGAMVQVSLVGYAVGGAFLGMAYFDLYYHLAAISLLTRLQVEKALAEDGVAVTTPAAVPTTAVFARESV